MISDFEEIEKWKSPVMDLTCVCGVLLSKASSCFFSISLIFEELKFNPDFQSFVLPSSHIWVGVLTNSSNKLWGQNTGSKFSKFKVILHINPRFCKKNMEMTILSNKELNCW